MGGVRVHVSPIHATNRGQADPRYPICGLSTRWFLIGTGQTTPIELLEQDSTMSEWWTTCVPAR
jgi:hypothetical protein